MKRAWRSALAIAVVLCVSVFSASAHPAISAVALVKVDAAGHVSITLRCDALAFALDESPMKINDAPMFEFLDAPESVQSEALAAAFERFVKLSEFQADGARIALEIDGFPTAQAIQSWRRTHPERVLPVKLDIVAHVELPAGAAAFSLRLPEVLGDVIVTVDQAGREPLGFPLRAGETSPALACSLSSDGKPDPNVQSADSTNQTQPISKQAGVIEVSARYAWLGFTHIIPEGADHALFVLGLFLLSPRAKALLWQITAFTIAHSCTLALTTFHIVKVSSAIVEPAIAASIMFIGIENLLTTKVHSWRPIVAFVFGLLHGMGFASALSDVGLPTGQVVAGLIAFNVGVEGGHLTVLIAAFLLIGWWRDRPWYRRRLAIPISVLIALISGVWMAQRIVGL